MAIAVEIIPLNGLIDINRASGPLLTALFAVAGGLDADRASALAGSVVAARVPGPATQRGPRFEAVEDLLQLPGVDFPLYARLSALVTTDSMGSGRVNAMAAPEGVLVVLSEGNTGRAARIATARDGGGGRHRYDRLDRSICGHGGRKALQARGTGAPDGWPAIVRYMDGGDRQGRA